MHQIHFPASFRWDSAPDPAGGAYSAPRHLPLFKGPISKGNGRGGRKGKGEERGQVEGFGPPTNFGVAPPMIANGYVLAYKMIFPVLDRRLIQL